MRFYRLKENKQFSFFQTYAVFRKLRRFIFASKFKVTKQ